jgi:hypothetical protein
MYYCDLDTISQDTSQNKFDKISSIREKIIEKHKGVNFCHTNGRKMNYRYYDVRTQHKKMEFAKKEFGKVKNSLKKEAIQRYNRRKKIAQKEKKEKGEMFYHGVLSGGFRTSLLRVNEEHHLLRRKYKKEFYDTDDDNVSMISTVDSLKQGLNAKRNGIPYVKKYLSFVFFKSVFIRMLTPETVKRLKTESEFTRVFLDLTLEDLTTDFTVSRLDIIEYKLFLDYLGKIFRSSIENIKPFRRIFYGMKSTFMILAVSLYELKERYKPAGSTSYYSDSMGVSENFYMASSYLILFKRMFDLETKILIAEEFVDTLIMFGETDEDIIYMLENFDSMLKELIADQIYNDFRKFFCHRVVELLNEEFGEEERNLFPEEYNLALGITVKKFLEDYTDI